MAAGPTRASSLNYIAKLIKDTEDNLANACKVKTRRQSTIESRQRTNKDEVSHQLQNQAGLGLSRSDPALKVVLEEEEDITRCSTPEDLNPSLHSAHFHAILEKARDIQMHLELLERLTNQLTELEEPADSQEEEQFIETSVLIVNDIHVTFRLLESALEPFFGLREMELLNEIRTRTNPAQDISIRFFGLPWTEVKMLLQGLHTHIKNLHRLVIGKKRPDLVLASLVINDLNKVHEDLVSHVEAVLKGRLNKFQNAVIR